MVIPLSPNLIDPEGHADGSKTLGIDGGVAAWVDASSADTEPGWTKTSGPVLSPSGAIESTSVQEPDVLCPDPAGVAGARMFYMGGWASPYQFAAITNDDGLTWTRVNAGTPVIGNGNGGESGFAAHCGYVKTPGGEVHAFYTNHVDSTVGSLYAVKSTDGGLTFGSKRTILTAAGWESGVWGNSAVVIDGAGLWHLLYEAKDGSGIWQTGYATSPDGSAGSWTRQNGGSPLTTLQVGTGSYGGCDLHIAADGTFEVFYHASTSGVLPTDLYHATSPDAITWTLSPSSFILTRTQSFEVDQIADPCVVTMHGDRVMFFDGVDNASSASKIGRATENSDGFVRTARSVATDSTLTGGGDLSADRTLGVAIPAELERIQDAVGAMVVAGTNITATYNDAAGTLTISASGGSTTVLRPLTTESGGVPDFVWDDNNELVMTEAPG